MSKKLLFILLLALSLVAWLVTSTRRGESPRRGLPEASLVKENNGLAEATAGSNALAAAGTNESPFAQKSEALEKQARAGFESLLQILQPYGAADRTRAVYIQYRTNRQGDVTVDFEVRSATHKASFVAGPLNPADGTPSVSGLMDGALLRLFESLHDGSDTRRKPEAMNTWHQATGKWSEAEAVGETFRLMERVGMPTNQVVRHRFRASEITVKDPAGNPVRVTPFYTVQMCRSDDDDYSYILGVQYRIGASGPAHLTRWESWPPIRVP